MQQLATSVCSHLLLTQRSSVHGLSSLHAVSYLQQVGSGSWVQEPQPLVTVQASMVQLFPSSHCDLSVQEPAMTLDVHLLVASQKSAVVHLPSSQSDAAVQQVGSPLSTNLHSLVARSQESIVQALLSLQSALPSQQLGLNASGPWMQV